MKIFISYRRADSTYLVGRIKDRLLAAFGPQSVFRDLDDIPAGVDFRTTLEKETRGCDVMLVVIGPQWAAITDENGDKRLFDPEDYTRIEVESGLRRLEQNEALVIPILVMNASMPAARELPDSLGKLTYRNAISIRNDPDFNVDMERLIRAIRGWRGYEEDDIDTEYFEPKTIYIAEGPFWMGSPVGEGIPQHETPRHEVHLPAYRIGKFPVRNCEYEEFIRQAGKQVPSTMGWDGQRAPPGRENHPVTGVSWYEALAYCEWLKEKTGRRYSLPDEAQWEKACRGGGTSIFPWGDVFDSERCNHGRSALAAVDAYPAQNEFGCFDLVGNIRQWTCTLWGETRTTPDAKYAYPWKDDGRNDLRASREVYRVVRGSTNEQDLNAHRCSARRAEAPELRGRTGFRVAMSM